MPHKDDGLVTQFLNWALTVGRLLIILTEGLALGVFLYRFTLDMKIVDLHDEIKNQSIILQNFKPLEDTYRNLQQRITLAKNYDAAGTITPTILQDIIAMGQGLITFKTIIIEDDSAKLEVQAPSTAAISDFINLLKGNPNILLVSIDKVENKTSNASITVGITAALKPSGIKTKENTDEKN
jgi:hypothetical protein